MIDCQLQKRTPLEEISGRSCGVSESAKQVFIVDVQPAALITHLAREFHFVKRSCDSQIFA
jgi:hypothetical protein